MPQPDIRPRVFAIRESEARPNNPTAKSVRLLTPESTGQARLYAGAYWNQPGSEAAWAFLPDDPDLGTMASGMPHLGDHDEVYVCLSGRTAVEWEGAGTSGSFEFGAGDVVHWPSGFTYHLRNVGDEAVHVVWVVSPAPPWMAPLGEAGS